MKDGNEPKQSATGMKPQQQTGERHGSIKRGQLNAHTMPERADVARGSEPETRGAGGRRS